MRFDYRGMGDSEGSARTFESIGSDIGAAIDAFFGSVPGVRRVVLWGLCDAASAILFFANRDPWIAGLVLVNPWARSPEGLARTQIRHYYLSRLKDPEFWAKVRSGGVNIRTAARGFLGSVRRALGIGGEASMAAPTVHGAQPAKRPLVERMLSGMQRFSGKVLFVISGDDLTAREFLDAVASSRAWQRAMQEARVEQRSLPDANHTFSRKVWRDQIASWTIEIGRAHV